MSMPGGSQLTFRPLRTDDLKAISLVHRRACLIAYRFMQWSYSLEEVEAWYSPKFAEWTWSQAAFDADAMAGFIALSDRHVDQLFIHSQYHPSGIGTALLVQALQNIPGPTTLPDFAAHQNAPAFYLIKRVCLRCHFVNIETGR